MDDLEAVSGSCDCGSDRPSRLWASCDGRGSLENKNSL